MKADRKLVAAAFMVVAGLCPAVAAEPPQVNTAQGAALIRLARNAMHSYLSDRTPAADIPTPPDLVDLNGRRYAAAVTVRTGGAASHTVVRTGDSLAGDVVSAALAAMRSDKLPDTITADVLNGLTVELEVLAGPRHIGEADIAAAVVPAATALSLSRGGETAYVYAAETYRRGLSASQMRDLCLQRLHLTNESSSARPIWSVHGTRQFVGFPDGSVVHLYRGKLLVAHQNMDADSLTADAVSIGRFLLSRQSNDGRYRVADEPPRLAEHLRTTCAMALLARTSGQPRFAESANAALGYAATFIRRMDDCAYVETAEARDQLAATAWAVLAIGRMPPSEQADALRAELASSLQTALLGGSGPSVRLNAEATALEASPADSALAYLALQSCKSDTQRLSAIRKSLSQAAPSDVESLLWLGRAGLRTDGLGQSLAELSVEQIGEPGLADERGGIGHKGRNPQTVTTAMLAGCPAAEPQMRLEARRFCRRMIYKPREAYFAARPDDWTGAVRARPGFSQVTLSACAAVIEAFLANEGR